MHGNVPSTELRATKLNDIGDAKSVIGDTRCDTSDGTPFNQWFPAACRGLFELKAGTALHYITGHDERSCQRYAAGTAEAKISFLRALLRSEQGWTWLSVVMDGADPQWWRELEAMRDLSIRYRIERK